MDEQREFVSRWRPRSGGRAVPLDPRTLAVALHDVEPATFERCVELRGWLDERGVNRVTLLVIPARDLHPLGERSPRMVTWLAKRRREGDSIAQHGFQHEQLRCANWPQRLLAPARTRRGAEFAGLDREETRAAVEAGWRLMKLAGIEPDGFVAPAYAYTPALRGALRVRFRWWASLLGLHGAAERPRRRLGPAWGPTSVRAGALFAGDTLRLDLSPTDLQQPRRLRALERVLLNAARVRLAVTYDELAGATYEPAGAPAQAEKTEASKAPALDLAA
jgi:predicted deacetylase